jgi:hypothetical protein
MHAMWITQVVAYQKRQPKLGGGGGSSSICALLMYMCTCSFCCAGLGGMCKAQNMTEH